MNTTDIVSQLDAALALEGIPESARSRGRALRDNLSRPVRVGIIGPEGGGKSTLVNLILGDRVLPEAASARAIEIVQGDAFVAEASYRDGSLEAPEQDELVEVCDAERLLIAAPYDILDQIALLEVRAEDEEGLEEVSRKADIVLWCSPLFGSSERAVWSSLEDTFRDHAFLVLTKADKLARKNRLADVLASLKDVAESEFAGLFPIATLQGLKALDPTPRDDALWTASGAEALIRAILDHARRGRQADLDQAELFLARYAGDPGVDESAADDRLRSGPRSRPRSQAMRHRSRPTRETSRATPADVGPRGAPPAQAPARPVARAEAPPPEEAVAATAPSHATPDARQTAPTHTLADRLGEVRRNVTRPLRDSGPDLATTALARLRSSGERLRGLPEHPGQVLSLCADTADALQEMFDAGPLPDTLAPLRDDLAQTSEMMTLLQLENAPGPAAEAVTLLLQIKRDLEQDRAA